jgi:hypothetical protein
MKIRIFNGAGSLIRNISLRLIQLAPVYLIIFVAYGDRFLPSPVDFWSYKIRTSINNILVGKVENELDDNFKNSKFNENRIERITEETEQQSEHRNKK